MRLEICMSFSCAPAGIPFAAPKHACRFLEVSCIFDCMVSLCMFQHGMPVMGGSFEVDLISIGRTRPPKSLIVMMYSCRVGQGLCQTLHMFVFPYECISLCHACVCDCVCCANRYSRSGMNWVHMDPYGTSGHICAQVVLLQKREKISTKPKKQPVETVQTINIIKTPNNQDFTHIAKPIQSINVI